MISTGVPIQVSGAARSALAGPAVKDRVGNLLVLTSRELLSLGNAVEISGAGRSILIGQRPTAYFHSETSEESAAHLVGWFAPTTKVARKNLISKTVENLCELLSRGVHIPPIGKGSVGHVSGLGCYARLKSETGPGIVTKGLLRVTLNMQSAHSIDAPIAGAIVTLPDRSLIGIVVGVQGDDLLVAPISDLFAGEGLELATADDIKTHNDKMRPKRHQKYPEAVSKIARMINFDGDLSDDWSLVIQDWVALGWRLHEQKIPNAFAPFQALFEGMAGPDDLAEKLWVFGLNELQGYSTNGLNWEEILGRVYTSIAYDQATESHTLMASPRVNARTELSGQSSHDHVVRNWAA